MQFSGIIIESFKTTNIRYFNSKTIHCESSKQPQYKFIVSFYYLNIYVSFCDVIHMQFICENFSFKNMKIEISI